MLIFGACVIVDHSVDDPIITPTSRLTTLFLLDVGYTLTLKQSYRSNVKALREQIK
jgi:hypothetical protein